jgi:signal transduction histidine kinase
MSSFRGGASPGRGRSARAAGRYTRGVMASPGAAHRLFAVGPRSGALFDLASTAAVFVGSMTLLVHSGIGASRAGSRDLDAMGVFLAACSTVPILAWRRFAFGVFVLTAAASVLLAGRGYPIGLPLGPTMALYLLAASRGPRAPWTGRTTALVVALFVTYMAAAASAQGSLPEIELHTGVAWAAAWFAGERTRLRREQIAELEERAHRFEREAERERRLAAAEERARIARDLHDSAGHAISVISVRAGAARLRHHQDPDRSLRALEAIEELARQTVDEIDQMVGTLREGSANGTVEAPPGLASLDTLIAQREAAGLQITCQTSGGPRSMGTAADQAAYRILQEALTNAARHGAGSARIDLAFGDAAADLTVTNPVARNGSTRPVDGHGLIGMRERATLLGGTFEIEHANGSFRVSARIPYGGHRA